MDAFAEGGKYFGLVQLEKEGRQKQFRFGISHSGYVSLKKILQLRPFDQMPGVAYRYFFVPKARKLDSHRATIAVRVEQGADSKEMEVEGDHDLTANLQWFYELDDLDKPGTWHLNANHKL